jgi:hypothetical protein
MKAILRPAQRSVRKSRSIRRFPFKSFGAMAYDERLTVPRPHGRRAAPERSLRGVALRPMGSTCRDFGLTPCASRAGRLGLGLDTFHGSFRAFAAPLAAIQMSRLHFSPGQHHREQRECGDNGGKDDESRDRHVNLLLSLLCGDAGIHL